ncbi:hypothetical protein SAMN05421636_103261 [Pricia antarctica]|uniref:Ribbon-helix-helix protein, copG family n=1 Tax=Pricia antarctica TaxID=641691 RepID=A0A1G7A7A4_9FLAO|nr:hypothetical protein [Pricia antarctica]SDE10563.1 hypothetical protein SAMN05421636_103261 [Pricia antarctica]
MKAVSLKIDDAIFSETEKIISEMKMPRNRYINEAIDFYNRLQKRNLIEKQLKSDSYAVREESMNVLREFEDLGYND